MNVRNAVVLFLALLAFLSCSVEHMEFDFSPYDQPEGLTDGEYIGEVSEGLDKAKVRVEIKDGEIVQVEILDVLAFGWRGRSVRDQLPSRFVATQGVDVDAVSGATGSTHAVKIALSRALEKSMTD
jgi:uncharacterized protein with FMN-binding domain